MSSPDISTQSAVDNVRNGGQWFIDMLLYMSYRFWKFLLPLIQRSYWDYSSSLLILPQQSECASWCFDQQVHFQQQITSEQKRMQSYLEDLVVLSSSPFENNPVSTPKSAYIPHSYHMESFQFPEPPHNPSTPGQPSTPCSTTATHPQTAPTTVIPALLLADISNKESTIELGPKKVSNLRANSCSRENFASKLGKELFTAEERMTSNVKGVMGKERYKWLTFRG